jgi:diguanylate cyclase (GGDEF)-like protein/PAS domain S-box-containing protein
MLFKNLKKLVPALFFCLFFLPVISAYASENAVREIFFEEGRDYGVYQYSQNGEFKGFETEIIKSVFNNSKYKLDFIHHGSNNSAKALSFVSAEEELEGFLKSNEVYSRDYGFFSMFNKRIVHISVNKIKYMKVGVPEHGFPLSKMKELDLKPVVYNDTKDGISALEKGEIELWFDDINDVNYILLQRNMKADIEYHEELSYSQPMCIAVPEGDMELFDYVNRNISRIKDSGEFEHLYLNYFLRHSGEYDKKKSQTQMLNYTLLAVVLLVVVWLAVSLKIDLKINKEKVSKSIANSILKHGNRFIILWKSDFSHNETNDYFKNTFGSRHEEISQNFINLFFKPDALLKQDKGSDDFEKNLNYDSVLTKEIDRNGELREISWTSILIDGKGDVKTVLSIGSDMTEKNRLRRELKLSDERYKLAMESASIAVIFIEKDGSISYISDLGYRLIGIEKSEKLDIQSLTEKIFFEDREEFAKKILNCNIYSSNFSSCEVRILTKNNEYRWFVFKFRHIFNPTTGAPCIAGAFYDINEDKEKDMKIEKLAFEDDLTGIFNRQKFMAVVKETLIDARFNNLKYAVMAFNLDNFHRFNDLFGVEAGDRILKNVALILKENPYGRTSVCARLGNDEFAVLAHIGSNDGHIEEYLKGISNKINEYTSENFDGMKCAISAGVCVYPDDVDDYHEVCERAVFSMRTAKDNPNIFIQRYDEKIKEMVLKRDLMEKEIRTAVEKGEFILYYQPKIDVKTEEIVGAEALIRWKHPKRGIVFPNEFIHIAEEMGLIGEIGKWTLREACRQNKLWQDSGLKEIKVSVNFSSVEFYQSDIVNFVKSVLDETGLDAKWLEIELTESRAIDDREETVRKMLELKELGVGISMDDFGTGYSSLGYIQNLPIDELKLDKSFIDKITGDEKARNIISTIIRLAKIIGLAVVAEGVEEREQFCLLKQMDCNMVQGYLFAKPLPEEEIIKMMKK